ncbi:uncharacterized protein F4822DRAFT_439912 [Hypoxylon trugodes]|uniref:uncharacterized protein n=1 Tax=Hypoxylon trugodes TaxID=326681 RepID=UPI00218FFB60|nr:uncharacterized protein F4822DRAFT_439912 [Hypoxylon trugodes]KAI1394317.1 hypothetical protein F4822DRAFT_439912 [Hypoxylon trugodes]
MSNFFRFFDLPRELRDLIYYKYVSVGGYIQNPETWRLRTVQDEPIDLNLMYTCHQVANEMKGVALSRNTINFRTTLGGTGNVYADAYDTLMERTDSMKRNMLRAARGCLTEETKAQVTQAYPKFTPVLDGLDKYWDHHRLGQVPTVFNEALDYTLRLMSYHPEFPQRMTEYEAELGLGRQGHTRAAFFSPHEPWDIPRRKDVLYLASINGYQPVDNSPRSANSPPVNSSPVKGQRCYSAAAMCILFLRCIPIETSAYLRDIVLHEDNAAVCEPATHARGLIGFCRENPRLRIERRVDIWKNAFLGEVMREDTPDFRGLDNDVVAQMIRAEVSVTMTRSIALWTIEAMTLQPLGMPTKSFSLVFHGGSVPANKSEEIFQKVIHRDAAMQLALEGCITRGHVAPCNPCQDRLYECHSFDSFPGIFHSVVDGKIPMIDFSFNPGDYSEYDIEEMIGERIWWTRDEWNGYTDNGEPCEGPSWLDRDGVSLNTPAPLPPWRELMEEIGGTG